MKKILLFCVILSIFLVGCGKSYKTYSKVEKIKIIRENNPEKLNKILEELVEAAAKGDKNAEQELTDWVLAGLEADL